VTGHTKLPWSVIFLHVKKPHGPTIHYIYTHTQGASVEKQGK